MAQWNGLVAARSGQASKANSTREAVAIGVSTPDNTVLIIGIGFIKSQNDLLAFVDGLIDEESYDAIASL